MSTSRESLHSSYIASIKWSISHGFKSITGNKTRSLGLVLILSLGITLIPSLMTWSSTGIKIELEDYIDESVYQLGIRSAMPESSISYHRYVEAETILINHPMVERVDRLISTIGLVMGNYRPFITYTFNEDLFYTTGVKDVRVIFASPDMISNWASLLTFEGNNQIEEDETIVGSRFLEYLQLATGLNLTIGDKITVDLLHGLDGNYPFYSHNSKTRLSDLTIAGIYTPVFATGVFGAAIKSEHRHLVDIFDTNLYPVLDLPDSMIVHQNSVSELVLEDIMKMSYFVPTTLVRANAAELLADGEYGVEDRILGMIGIMSEYSIIESWGVTQADKLDRIISTYIQSRVLIILGFPALFIALLVTLSSSESSVLKRKFETSLLRAKGASYNQVLFGYMFESLVLCGASLSLGVALSLVLAPAIGSSNGLFIFDADRFIRFMSTIVINNTGLIFGTILSLCLPISFMIHATRHIETWDFEDSKGVNDTSLVDTISTRRGIGIFLAVLTLTALLPIIFTTTDINAIYLILICTAALYITATLGAVLMRKFVGYVNGKISFLIGEKCVYVSNSLIRRTGRFTSLLIVLTLIIATTFTMVVQVQSFQSNLDDELVYSIGADLRIELPESPLLINRSLRHIPGIIDTTQVLEVVGKIGEFRFNLEGVNAEKYSQIGDFRPESFTLGSPQDVLSDLHNTRNGIILSESFSQMWNKTIGESITVSVYGPTPLNVQFRIVGFVQSAPGFGAASRSDTPTGISNIGFQVGLGGFALVNLDHLSELTGIGEINLVFASVLDETNVTDLVDIIETAYDATVFTSADYHPEEISEEAVLFLRGYEGMTSVLLILLVGMGAFAIIALLGSSVDDRSKEYALLKAVGATDRQILVMVSSEFISTVIAAMLISTFLGIAIGTVMSMLTFAISPLNPILFHFPLVFTPALGIIILFEFILLVLSSIIPSKRAIHTRPAEQLRNL
ncbi:MAG: FtsX-like permease family protein [Candidatus Thorarchaeota archaeon]